MYCSFVMICALAALGAAPAEISLETKVIGDTLGSAGRFGVLWDTPRHAWATRTADAPTLDGKLDDACWAESAVLTGFIVGGQNRARPNRDRVLICYDDQKLYLGCTFGEPNPKRIKTDVKEDGVVGIWTDDSVEVHIGVDIHKVYSPKYDYPCWAQFITNAAGARFAQIRFRSERGTSSRQRPWNDQWLSASRVGKGRLAHGDLDSVGLASTLAGRRWLVPNERVEESGQHDRELEHDGVSSAGQVRLRSLRWRRRCRHRDPRGMGQLYRG